MTISVDMIFWKQKFRDYWTATQCDFY